MHFVEEKASSSSAAKGSIRNSDRSRREAASHMAPAIAIAICSITQGTLDLWAATSIRRYWATEARLTFPKLARQSPARRDVGRAPRLSTGGLLRHRSRLGSRRRRRATPSNRTCSVRASASGPFRSCWWASGVEYLNPKLGPGKDSRVPRSRSVFDPTTAPGLEPIGGLPALDGLSGSRLSRAEERAQGRMVSRRLLAIRRSDHRPLHVQPRRHRPPSVRRIPRRATGDRGTAVRLDVGHRCRPRDAVLPDADARRKRHAARISGVPVPGTARDSGAGGVSLGNLERARRRALLRRGQSRRTAAPT